MATESTVRDALVAEMLGDIGKLHDAVESLKDVLPRETEAAEKRITGLIGLLQKAGDAYQGQIEAYADSKLRAIHRRLETDGNAAEERVGLAVEAALSEVARTVNSTVRNAMSDPVQELEQMLRRCFWTNLSLCLLAGLVGGGIPMFAWLASR